MLRSSVGRTDHSRCLKRITKGDELELARSVKPYLERRFFFFGQDPCIFHPREEMKCITSPTIWTQMWVLQSQSIIVDFLPFLRPLLPVTRSVEIHINQLPYSNHAIKEAWKLIECLGLRSTVGWNSKRDSDRIIQNHHVIQQQKDSEMQGVLIRSLISVRRNVLFEMNSLTMHTRALPPKNRRPRGL